MTWKPNTLVSPKMWQWELNSLLHNSRMSTSQWTVLHISTPFQPLANPPTCIAALYTKSKAGIAFKCSLQLHKTTTTNLPTQITPDVWILTTPATAPINTVTLICPGKPMETIPIWQLIHILKLPTAYSATSSHFYLPPRYETPILDVNVSLKMANLQMINILHNIFAYGNTWEKTEVICNYNIWQLYSQFQYTGFISTFLMAPHQLCLLILNHQRILIPSGVCSPTQEYTFQF